MRVGLIGLNPSATGGGLDRYAQTLASGLREEGVEAEPIWTGHPETRFAKTLHSWVSIPLEASEEYRKYDLVHATTPGMAVAFRFISDEVPKIVTMHDLIPILEYETINGTYTFLNRVFNWFNWVVFQTWMKIGVRAADKLISVSSLTKNQLEDRGYNDISVVPEYVDDKFKDVREPEDGLFGVFAPLVHRKGVHRAIEAFRHLDKLGDYRLKICGSEDKEGYLELLRGMIEDYGLEESVEIKGWIEEGKLVETLNKFQAILYPCYNEGFGLPILEAVRCKTPILTLEGASIPEETQSLSVVARDERDMAVKAHELASDEEKREKIVEESHNESLTFTRERTVEETIKVYEEVLENAR